MVIDKVDFDGVVYPIITKTKSNLESGSVTTFETVIGEKELALSARWDNETLSTLTLLHGYGAADELKRLVIYEIKLDIFEHIYNTTSRDQMNKIYELVGKDDCALYELIEKDDTFAAYVRNFHSEQYTSRESQE